MRYIVPPLNAYARTNAVLNNAKVCIFSDWRSESSIKKEQYICPFFHTVKYTGSDDYDVQNRKKNIIEHKESLDKIAKFIL